MRAVLATRKTTTRAKIRSRTTTTMIARRALEGYFSVYGVFSLPPALIIFWDGKKSLGCFCVLLLRVQVDVLLSFLCFLIHGAGV